MPKPYQHHDEYHDIGKAEPKPKRPTTNARKYKRNETVIMTGTTGRKKKSPEAARADKLAARRSPVRHTPPKSTKQTSRCSRRS